MTVGQYVPALAALDEALRLRRMLGQQHLLWEPLAHLVQTHLLLKDEIHAAHCIHEPRCLLDLAPCTAGVHHPAAVQWLQQDLQPGKTYLDFSRLVSPAI